MKAERDTDSDVEVIVAALSGVCFLWRCIVGPQQLLAENPRGGFRGNM